MKGLYYRYTISNLSDRLTKHCWYFFDDKSYTLYKDEILHVIAQCFSLFFLLGTYTCMDTLSLSYLDEFAPCNPKEFAEAVENIGMAKHQNALQEVTFEAQYIYKKLKNEEKVCKSDLFFLSTASDKGYLSTSKSFQNAVIPDMVDAINRFPKILQDEALSCARAEFRGYEWFYDMDSITYPELDFPRVRSDEEIFEVFPDIDPDELYNRTINGLVRWLKNLDNKKQPTLFFEFSDSYWDEIKKEIVREDGFVVHYPHVEIHLCDKLIASLTKKEWCVLWVYLYPNPPDPIHRRIDCEIEERILKILYDLAKKEAETEAKAINNH